MQVESVADLFYQLRIVQTVNIKPELALLRRRLQCPGISCCQRLLGNRSPSYSKNPIVGCAVLISPTCTKEPGAMPIFLERSFFEDNLRIFFIGLCDFSRYTVG